MSSPTSRPDPVALSTAEQAALSRIAGHERVRDPRFADALARGDRRVRRGLGVGLTMLAVLGAVALVVTALAVSGPWLVAIVAVGVLAVVPAGLVVWAVRQGTVDPDGRA